MVREMARVTRRGGWVCALNEGTRALGAPGDVPDQAEEKGFGINEHVHTLYAYLWAFARAGLVVRRVEQAEGYDELAGRRIAGRLLAAAGRGAKRRDVVLADVPRLLGREPLCPEGPALDCSSMGVYADLVRYRELFGSLFRRDLQARYKGTVFGVAWSLANPLLLMAIYVLVFSLLWKVTTIDHYPLFLLCGLAVWIFFSSSLTGASRSMIDYAELIKKVRFPRQLVAFSVVATQLVPFAAMLAGLIVVDAIVLPRDARHGAALDPDRRRASSSSPPASRSRSRRRTSSSATSSTCSRRCSCRGSSSRRSSTRSRSCPAASTSTRRSSTSCTGRTR